MVVYPGQPFTVFGSFTRLDPDKYQATIEGIPCTIQSVTRSSMQVLPHPNLLGAGYLTVTMLIDPDRPARLPKRLHIMKSGAPFDTTTVDSIHFADPVLKVTNPGRAWYLLDLSLDIRGLELPADSFVVNIGPLAISNATRQNSLIKTTNGLTIPAGNLDLPDGNYPVYVTIPSRGRIASGVNVTLGPLPFTAPTEQVYPGDTLTFEKYYSELYAMVNNVRYSEGDPVHGLWRDGSSERMQVGPIASLADGMTVINFVSVKTGRIVATSTVNSSQQRTEDLQWTPQQQYAGRSIEITYPRISSSFDLERCTIGGAGTEVVRASLTQATILLGPDVKQEGIITLTFRDPNDGSRIVINSRNPFTPLLRGDPPVPSRFLRINVAVPGQWERRSNGTIETTPGIESFTVDLENTCAGQWCDTNVTSTRIPYWSVKTNQIDSYSETDSAYGSITFWQTAGSVERLRASQYHSEKVSNHNTTYDRFHDLSFEFAELGMAAKNSDGSHTITLTGDEAYRAIRSVRYVYFNTTRNGSSEGTSWLKLVRLEPTLAAQCAITLTFSQ